MEANAPEVLATMLPAGSVTELWVFFPDPWHKSRHHKRRLIQPAFAELASRAVKPGGLWRIATDWSNYAVHVRDVMAGSPDFDNLHDGERTGPESPLTQVWQSGVESLVAVPVKEGRPPVSTEHTGPNEGIDETGGWAPRFDGRIRTSFENKPTRRAASSSTFATGAARPGFVGFVAFWRHLGVIGPVASLGREMKTQL